MEPKHEVRLTTYSDLMIPPVAPPIPRRQKMMMDYDLSQASVDCALRLVGGLDPGDSAYIVCGEDLREPAVAIGAHFRLPVVLLPPEIMHDAYCWAVVGPKGSVFATPPA